jgi:glycosyltransferase involved in cell wall biosynthesis
MRIALATVQVPFIRGGAEILAEQLRNHLRLRGHSAEIVSIPFKWYPGETLLACMVAGRLMDLTEVNGEKIDLVIGLKFPAYYAPHPNKVLWLIHQHRQAYDLWETEFGDIHQWPNAEFVRDTIIINDNKLLPEANRIFTISENNSGRLRKYNGLESTPLYHPPISVERLHCAAYDPFVFYPSRIDRMKRQYLLIEAAQYLRSGARIVISGKGSDSETQRLNRLVKDYHLENRVDLVGYISEEEKVEYLARCSAVYFGAYDEDYGYVPLEAMFSQKPVIALSDTGGALEFVRDGHNGYVVKPDPRLVAERIDELISSPALARRLGANGLATMSEKRVDWNYAIDCLLEASHA